MQKPFEKKLGEEVAAKAVEIKRMCNEKVELEEKVNSLLDTLYGCNHCGRQECALNCEEYEEFLKAENAEAGNADYENADDVGHDTPEQSELQQVILQPAMKTPTTTVTPSPPPYQSSTWSPPPTPPCSSCGADNYGPCPGTLCFACIPHIYKDHHITAVLHLLHPLEHHHY